MFFLYPQDENKNVSPIERIKSEEEQPSTSTKATDELKLLGERDKEVDKPAANARRKSILPDGDGSNSHNTIRTTVSKFFLEMHDFILRSQIQLQADFTSSGA